MSVRRTLPGLQSLPRYRSKAYRAIEAVLREDPILSRVIKTWRTREGEPGEMAPPTSDQMPMLALSPIPRPSAMLGIDETRINFAVLIQLFVNGTCVDDILDLWEAVEDAIVDQKPFRDTNVAGYLCQAIDPAPAGVMVLRPETPAFSPVDLLHPPKNVLSQRGEGTLVCFLRRPSAKSNLPL